MALADDQELVRDGLRALLTKLEFDVICEAPDGASLLEFLCKTPAVEADVVLSDIRMPGLDGISMVRALRAYGHKTPVVLLTTFEDSELLLAAVEAGAQAFLLKDASSADLRDAILSAKRGERWLAPVSTRPLHNHVDFRSGGPPQLQFGQREIEILRLLAGGYSNKEIARTIHLAEGTVKNYVSDILTKLETRDRTRAVLKAITLRIV